MPITTDEGLVIVSRHLKTGVTHQDYGRTVALAAKYKRLITGEDITPLLKQFNPREDGDQFEQRVRITEVVTPAITEKVRQPFRKVSRLDNLTKVIAFPDDAEGERVVELNDKIGSFWGNQSLDDYLETRYEELSFQDPNTWIIVEFDVFDNTVEKATPFPVEVPAVNALNFKFENNNLQWLLVRMVTTFERKGEGEQKKTVRIRGWQYRLYMQDEVLIFTEVDAKANASASTTLPKDIPSQGVLFKVKNKLENGQTEERVFIITKAEPLAGQVQACRVGYKGDTQTDSRTFVNPFHPAMARLMKSIKSVSELDLSMALHTFPQKIQYVESCPGENQTKRCSKGINPDGSKCKECNGAGFVLHRSAQDAIYLPMPKALEDMVDLNKMLVYKSPPIDLLTFQDKYTKELEIEAVKDVFVSETFNRVTGSATATENMNDMESVYDTLLPYANNYSMVWLKFVNLIAVFTDNEEDLQLVHSFPKDFKLKTTTALIHDRKAAKDAGAPAFLLQEIDQDIAEKIWADDPVMLNKFNVAQSHLPFKGKTDVEIALLLANKLTPKAELTLWANFEGILRLIRADDVGRTISFFDMEFGKRVEIIDAKVAEVQAVIESETPKVTGFGLPPEEPEEGDE